MIQNNLYFCLASSQLFPVEALEGKTTITATVLEKLEKARDLVSNKAYEQALDLYNSLVEEYPSQPFFYACRSITKSKNKDDEGAYYDYQVAKGMDINYHNFLEWLENRGQMVQSEDLKELIENPKSEESYYLKRAALYVQHFDYENAIADFSTALTIHNSPIIQVTRAAIYMRLLRYDLALAEFNDALTKDKQLVQAYLYRAKLYVALREYSLASADFDAAIANNGQDVHIYEERAQLYELTEKWDLAIADYTQAIALEPTDFYMYVLRADVYEKTDNLDEALQDYNKAIALNPYYSDLYQYRADIYNKLGDALKAEQDIIMFEKLEEEERE